MPTKETIYKIFIASPSGLNLERKAFAEVIEEYNKSNAIIRGVSFRAVGWEDTLSGMGRPQAQIDEDLKKCDFFILLLHNRWGSNPGKNAHNATSGTEEEYRLAIECYNNKNTHMKQIVCAFKSVSLEQLADPGKQLQKVIDFKKELDEEKQLLYSSFFSLEEFKSIIRKQLGRWLLNHEKKSRKNKKMKVEIPLTQEENILVETEEMDIPTANTNTREIINNAMNLANDGKLTEAEIEFSKAIIYSPGTYELLNYASFLVNIGQLDKALVMLDRVIGSNKDSIYTSNAYSYKGRIFRIRGNIKKAMIMYKKALKMNKQLKSKEGIARNHANIGTLMKNCGDLEKAEIRYRKSLKISKRINFTEGIANQYGNLGNISATRGELKKAEKLYNKSLKTYKIIEDSKGRANQLINLGILKKDRKDYKGAKKMYKKALKIYDKLGYVAHVGVAYTNLGNMLRIYGDLEESEKMCKKAIQISKKLSRLDGLAANYGNLGIIYSLREDFKKAEEMCKKALNINIQLSRLEGIAKQYGNLGNINKSQGYLDEAKKMYKKCLEISKKQGFSKTIKAATESLKELKKAEKTSMN